MVLVSNQYRILAIKKAIRKVAEQYHRNENDIQLLAISKGHSATAIEEVFSQGQYAFGESYLQEAIGKINVLAHLPIEWHFVGSVQSNKAKLIAKYFSWVHSIDRTIILQRLNAHRPDYLPPLNACVQVKLVNESSKFGVSLAELDKLVRSFSNFHRLQLRGLMTILPKNIDFSDQVEQFCLLKQALLNLNVSLSLNLSTLSMGTSNDYIAAIAAGSTLVRIGRRIFVEKL